MSGNATNQELRGDSFQFSNALTYFVMKRFGCLIIGGIVLAVAAWFVWAFLRDRQLYTHIDGIKTGASETDVVHELGRPKRVEKCGEFWGPFPKEELEGCKQEYFYASPFAPLLAQYYVVWFDANDRVKSVHSYSSP
jgi:hypothetical protein